MSPRPWIAHYDAGVPADLASVGASVPQRLEASAKRFPARCALVFEGARTSYAELFEQVRRCAAGLRRLGLERGGRVAIQLPNLPQTVIAYHAALRLGAQVVLTNPLYTTEEALHQWSDAGCTLAFVTDYLYAQHYAAAQQRFPIRHWIATAIAERMPWPKRWIAPFVLARRDPSLSARVHFGANVHRFRELVRTPLDSNEPALPALDELAVLQYTGGTTGTPKAAMLSHRNLAANIEQIDGWFTTRVLGEEVCLTCLPLFHVFGMTVCMNWPLAMAAKIVLAPDPRDLTRLVRAIARERVTLFPSVPALFNGILNHPEVGRLDLRSVKVCVSGSAPLAPDVMQRFEAVTGSRIVEGYGLSETSPVTHVNPLGGERRVGSIGLPVTGTEVRIVDADDSARELAQGEQGELLVRGPQVMQGYWQRPEETAAVLRDGWFATGDLATMDADGYFRIVGRKKDMINVSGFKVYPDEVDKRLAAHPAVLEAATIGVPRDGREIVKSFVVLKSGQQASVEQLRDFCREVLAPYKVPRELEFVAALPKSTVLKVLRRELRELELARQRQRGS